MIEFKKFKQFNEAHMDVKASAQDAINDAKLEALKTLKTVFNKHGAKFWLDSGTLLGVVREGDFLPNDSDWDVGCHGKYITDPLIKDLKEAFNLEREGGTPDDFYTIGLISKDKDGKNVSIEGTKIWGDINVYYPMEDRFVCSLRLDGKKGPYYYVPKEVVTPGTKSVKLRGQSFDILKESKAALDMMYHNWKTPDRSKTSYPNRCTSWVEKAINLTYNRGDNKMTMTWPNDFDPTETEDK